MQEETPKPSLPSRGAWIEIGPEGRKKLLDESLPSRGAWIEILNAQTQLQAMNVAPLAGSVD